MSRYSIVLIFLLSSIATANIEKNDFANVDKELIKHQKTINSLSKDINQSKSKTKKSFQTLKKLDKKINQFSLEIYNVDKKIKELQAKLQLQEQQSLNLQLNLNKEKSNLKQNLKKFQIIFYNKPIKIMLNQKDINNYSRNVVYYDYLYKNYYDKLNNIQNDIINKDILCQSIATEQKKFMRLKNSKLLSLKNLKQSYSLQQQLVATIDQNITNKKSTLKNLEQQVKKLKTTKKLATSPDLNFKVLTIPINNKNLKTITRLENNSRYVIPTNLGQPVKAIYEGKVVFANWLKGYGLLTIVDHGNGILSLYGQSQTLFKNVGDFVMQGETISLTGKSGGQAKAGLYFEIRKNGKSIKLDKWLEHGKFKIV